MSNRTRILASVLLVAAACGDDGSNNNNNNDGGTGDGSGSNTCATAPLSISTYPGMVSGTIMGAGKKLSVAEGGCTDEQNYFEPTGDDNVVALTGLTVGVKYGLTLQAADDLSLYVTTDCPPANGAVTNCSLFADTGAADDGEAAAFTATATTHYVVIDNGEFADLTDGAFTLSVTPDATCQPFTADTDCTDIDNPFCVGFGCHQCDPASAVNLNCPAATPVCGDAASCEAGPTMCVNDDASDTTGTGDDGPNAATTIAAPTAGNPTVVNNKICDAPQGLKEADWFKITLSTNVSIQLGFTGTGNDLDLYFLDAQGRVQGSSAQNGELQEALLTDVAAGTYYIVVDQYTPMNSIATIPYTLTVSVPECDPDAFRSCTTGAKPVCGAAGLCGQGPATCVGDTNGEPQDDGPAGARALVTGVAQQGQICSVDGEEDWYSFTVINGQGETLSLAWADDTVDLDLYVYDATGKLYGESWYVRPEVVTLTNLATGTYYVKVVNFAQTASTTSQAYTLTGTTTAITQCTGAASCAAEYKTQVYRGSCNTTTDVCSFQAGAGAVALGAACDSTDDCVANSRCSYILFEADAQKSICTPTSCTTNADCTGTNANLRCTTGFQTNVCEPACATDLECGAIPSNSPPDANQPWDYLTCTVATGACGA